MQRHSRPRCRRASGPCPAAPAGRRIRTDQGGVRAGPPARRGGFTLIELLVVISIILLLASILVPVIRGVLRSGEAGTTRAQVSYLITEIEKYKKETHHYPGLDEPGWANIGSDATGSQILARRLYTPLDGDSDDFPEGRKFKRTFLIEYARRAHTLSDLASDPMPICYYPARPVSQGEAPRDRYHYRHNEPYTEPGSAAFYDFLDRREARAEYLLIAPGPDRKYFTDDDVRNF